MVFHWSLSGLQVLCLQYSSDYFLSILTILWPARCWFFPWFPISPVIFLTFSDHFKLTNCNWYHFHSYVPQFFFLLFSNVQVFIYLSAFFYFHSVICQEGKIHWTTFFSCSLTLVFWLRLSNPRESYSSFSYYYYYYHYHYYYYYYYY